MKIAQMPEGATPDAGAQSSVRQIKHADQGAWQSPGMVK